MIKSPRIESIDLLRGIVMIFMALDHVRDYFHADAFLYNPTDMTKTSVILFFTRWITHYCAPVFMFLAGTSAFIISTRKSKNELSIFLLKRGLWLVFLEVTVLNFGWFFNIHFPLITLQVIWAIGIAMIVLAAFVHLPFKVILTFALILIVGHNAFDSVHVEGNSITAILWSMLHEFAFFPLESGRTIVIAYPIIPWIAVMMLGYCFGKLYQPPFDAVLRKKLLLYIGSAAIILFVAIRFANIYGDPSHWSPQASPMFTFLSFIDVTKYPPSLLYILITLGPAILFLGFAEKYTGSFAQKVIVLGRVPMFYYTLHVYLVHALAMFAAVLTGYSASDMVFSVWLNNSPDLVGFGFGLGVVYLIWIGVVLFLYPLCNWYNNYKMDNRDKWWLSYL